MLQLINTGKETTKGLVHPRSDVEASLSVLLLGPWRRQIEIERHRLDRLGGVAGGDGDGDESLGLADGAGLLELDVVADLELVLGVMGLVLLLLAHAALVLGVGGEADDLHRHGLVAGGADHPALHGLHGPDGEGGGRGRSRRGRGGERWDLGKRREGAMEEGRRVAEIEVEEGRDEGHGVGDKGRRGHEPLCSLFYRTASVFSCVEDLDEAFDQTDKAYSNWKMEH